MNSSKEETLEQLTGWASIGFSRKPKQGREERESFKEHLEVLLASQKQEILNEVEEAINKALGIDKLNEVWISKDDLLSYIKTMRKL